MADLAHPVRDIDDADAPRLRLLDHGEQALRFAIGERGRRFVEDQHREVGAERLGDLDHLLLGAGEILDPLARPQREAEPLEDVVGAAVQRRLVEKAAARQLGAEKQILLDGERRHQREFLEHGADAERAGVMDALKVERFAAKAKAAGGRNVHAGEHLDQG